MPRYFFHLTTPSGTDLDDTGIEWPDPNFAYLEACKAIPDTVLERTVAIQLISPSKLSMRPATFCGTSRCSNGWRSSACDTADAKSR